MCTRLLAYTNTIHVGLSFVEHTYIDNLIVRVRAPVDSSSNRMMMRTYRTNISTSEYLAQTLWTSSPCLTWWLPSPHSCWANNVVGTCHTNEKLISNGSSAAHFYDVASTTCCILVCVCVIIEKTIYFVVTVMFASSRGLCALQRDSAVQRNWQNKKLANTHTYTHTLTNWCRSRPDSFLACVCSTWLCLGPLSGTDELVPRNDLNKCVPRYTRFVCACLAGFRACSSSFACVWLMRMGHWHSTHSRCRRRRRRSHRCRCRHPQQRLFAVHPNINIRWTFRGIMDNLQRLHQHATFASERRQTGASVTRIRLTARIVFFLIYEQRPEKQYAFAYVFVEFVPFDVQLHTFADICTSQQHPQHAIKKTQCPTLNMWRRMQTSLWICNACAECIA